MHDASVLFTLTFTACWDIFSFVQIRPLVVVVVNHSPRLILPRLRLLLPNMAATRHARVAVAMAVAGRR